MFKPNNQDPAISLVQHNAEIQWRNGHDMEVDTAEPVYTASVAVTTASIIVRTASPTRISTADDITMAETLVYIRKSAAKDKDIRARIKAVEELVQRLQTEERKKYNEDKQKLSFDEIKDLFEITMKRVNTFVPMETEVRRGVPELVANSLYTAVREVGGTKKDAEEELGHQSSKKQKSCKLSQEELQHLMII
nr:hypothetical protein [Tanacetum cinerariifolium]